MFYDQVFAANPFVEPNDAVLQVLQECAGYSIYDMLVMAAKPHESPAMWVHHLLSSLGPITYMLCKQGVYFGFPLIITELTVPIVNLLWFMLRMTDMRPKTRHVLLGLRALSYVVLRLFTVPAILWFAVRWCSAYVAHSHTMASTLAVAASSTTPIFKLNSLQQLLLPLGQTPLSVHAFTGLTGRSNMIVPRLADLYCFWHFFRQLSWARLLEPFHLQEGAGALNVLWTRDAVRSFVRHWQKHRISR